MTVYRVWTKFWTENSIGEQTEGPWVPREVFCTRWRAEEKAAEYRSHGGCWAEVRLESPWR